MDEEIKVYKLYALARNETNIDTVTAERFHRITSGYILTFTQGEQPKGSIEISAAEASQLTDYDKAWLRDCVGIVMLEKVSTQENINSMMSVLEKIEKALEEQQERLNEEKE